MNLQALTLSLWITLIGMALVFGAIVVLWMGMAILVRLTSDATQLEDQTRDLGNDSEKSEENKRMAAAVAVATALRLRKSSTTSDQQFPLPPTALVSAWQAVMRANTFSKRGRVR